MSYAILALLAARPQSGYDMSREMKPPLGYLWVAKHGQIYPELSRLLKSGLIALKRTDQGSGPPRRVHAITAAGRTELARWVVRPPQFKPMNDELVIKAYALGRVRPQAATSLIQDQILLHQRRLAALEQMSEAMRSRASSARHDSVQFGERAALRRAIGQERDYIAWCRWLLEELSARPKKTTGTRGAPSRSSQRTAKKTPR